MTKVLKQTEVTNHIDLTKLDTMTQMSQRIRYLHSLNIPRGDIARILNIRYQWVRNVLITPLKKMSQ